MHHLLVFVLHSVVRGLLVRIGRVGRTLVRPWSLDGSWSLGAMGLSVDLDSSRLDAVSRSLAWGAGMLVPCPVHASDPTSSSPTGAMRPHPAKGPAFRRRLT
jgi:hypothetical protein